MRLSTNGVGKLLRINNAGKVAISTNGTGRLFVDASGNVSLSSTTSLISTNTADAADDKRLILTGGGAIGVERGAYINLQGNEFSGGGNAQIVAGDNGFINFSTGSGSERLRIDSSGNLLIGGTLPSSPNARIDSNGSAKFNQYNIISGSYQILVNTTKTVTVSGLQFGTLEFNIGGYAGAGGGYLHRKISAGGFFSGATIYDVRDLFTAQTSNQVSTSAITKNSSNFTFTITVSGLAPFTLIGYWSCLYVSGNPVTVTIA